MKRWIFVPVATLLSLFLYGFYGCASQIAPAVHESIPASSLAASLPSSVSAPSAAIPPKTPERPPLVNSCVQTIADDVVASLLLDGMNDSQKIQAAYEYVVINTIFADPVGMDVWRIRAPGSAVPPYLETRAISPLAFGIGSCEDYAAALVILLTRMGFSAKYVPGLTLSLGGGFVDHAWAMVRLEGNWFHLDPQLEDNILKNDTLTYRYFLKSDETMLTDHRWGHNLLTSAELSPGQISTIKNEYLPPVCPKDFRTPKALKISPKKVNRADTLVALEQEKQRFEAEHGKLPDSVLSVIPPVFGTEGYGDPAH